MKENTFSARVFYFISESSFPACFLLSHKVPECETNRACLIIPLPQAVEFTFITFGLGSHPGVQFRVPRPPLTGSP